MENFVTVFLYVLRFFVLDALGIAYMRAWAGGVVWVYVHIIHDCEPERYMSVTWNGFLVFDRARWLILLYWEIDSSISPNPSQFICRASKL
jgi:hypothetical protein